MEGISLFLWILYEKGSHESYYHANTEKRSPPGNPRRNSRLGRTIPNQPAAPATPGAPVVDLQYKKREASLLLLYGFRQRPTLPGRVQPSTIGAEGLNFCVRYGNRWDPFAIITGNCELFLPHTLTTAQLFDLNFYAFSPISLPDFACNQALDRLVSSSYIRYRTSTDDLSTW